MCGYLWIQYMLYLLFGPINLRSCSDSEWGL